MALGYIKIALEIKEVGIALQAIVGIQILIGQGVVPNPAMAEFKDCWTVKQRDLVLAQVKG